jgi:hypothetical protein
MTWRTNRTLGRAQWIGSSRRGYQFGDRAFTATDSPDGIAVCHGGRVACSLKHGDIASEHLSKQEVCREIIGELGGAASRFRVELVQAHLRPVMKPVTAVRSSAPSL